MRPICWLFNSFQLNCLWRQIICVQMNLLKVYNQTILRKVCRWIYDFNGIFHCKHLSSISYYTCHTSQFLKRKLKAQPSPSCQFTVVDLTLSRIFAWKREEMKVKDNSSLKIWWRERHIPCKIDERLRWRRIQISFWRLVSSYLSFSPDINALNVDGEYFCNWLKCVGLFRKPSLSQITSDLKVSTCCTWIESCRIV